jgi:NAD(P)-dependent dehydrogenase (short-subunit alcohol dehydrogenase family)
VAQEVAPFGVVMTTLEPGAMRTNWGKRAHGKPVELLLDYEQTVGAATKRFEAIWGNESGDPEKVAQLVLKITNAMTLPSHILLGSDALQFARQAEARRTEEMNRWEAISRSVDFDAKGPVPNLPLA